jgi:hypothetical protein
MNHKANQHYCHPKNASTTLENELLPILLLLNIVVVGLAVAIVNNYLSFVISR